MIKPQETTIDELLIQINQHLKDYPDDIEELLQATIRIALRDRRSALYKVANLTSLLKSPNE